MTSDCGYCAHQFYVQDDKSLPECTLSDGKPCVACERQAKLHIRIQETKKLLDELVAEEREAREDINSHHDPIHRLPIEITSHIFRFTLPHFRTKEVVPRRLLYSGNEYCEHQGLTLGAVCHGWRKVAWSTPRLWCNIMVSLLYQPTWIQIQVMKDWLERSKPLPLKISLFLVDENYGYIAKRGRGFHVDIDNYGNRYNTLRSEALKAFIDLFNQHSARWKTLSMQSFHWLSDRLTGDKDHGAPLLKNLRLLNLDSEYLTDCMFFKLDGPKPAPTCVDVTGYSSISALVISWSNVTHATLDRLKLYSLEEFLRLVPPRLIDLTLNIIWETPDSTTTAATPPIHLPLQRLLVSTPDCLRAETAERFYSVVFDSLVLPMLEDLTILNTELPFKSVKRFLERSCPPLKDLFMNIICESDHQQEALEFLYALPPSLTNIELNWEPRGQSQDFNLQTLFDHLARLPAITDGNPTRTPLLPNIECFEYHISRKSSDPALWGRLPEILRPISGNPRPLKLLGFVERSVRREDARPFLYKGLNIEKNVIQGIIGLLDDGVDVRLPRRVSRERLLALLED